MTIENYSIYDKGFTTALEKILTQPLLWTKENLSQLFELPFFSLISKAQACHQLHFPGGSIEGCVLSNIKTGHCPEDCAYCPQSGHYQTGLKAEKRVDLAKVIEDAKRAKQMGAKRLCLGAAWRSPPKKDFEAVLAMISAVKAEGLEACVTLGQLDQQQAQALKEAGLDFYNHNIDTSPSFYSKIISTRTFQDRIDTLHHAGEAGLNLCCGGIMGMGESREDRVDFFLALLTLPYPLKSIPINRLIPIPGTPLDNTPTLDNFEFIRTIAVARILFPSAIVRLSAGRAEMSAEMQAWCFMAGANSIWLGEKLLTTANSELASDEQLFKTLNLSWKTEDAPA